MKAIVVTGGAGFIGSYTSLLLLEKGYSVFIIDSLTNSFYDSIKKVKQIYFSRHKNVSNSIQFFKGDLKNLNDIEEFFEDIIKKNFIIEVVYHFASLKSSSSSIDNPFEYWENNFIGTFNLLKVINKYGCNKFIFSSSAIVYGSENSFPVTEKSKLNPINPYANTKYAVEIFLKDLICSKNSNLQVVCLRYFNPIGAFEAGALGERPKNKSDNLFPLICDVASNKIDELIIYGNDWPTTDGTCVRDYIHIMDLAEAHIKTLDYLIFNHDKYHVFNIGTGKGVSVIELVQTFEKVNKIKINYKFGPRRKGDSPISFANCDLAKNKLNWESNRNLNDMCLDGWESYKLLDC